MLQEIEPYRIENHYDLEKKPGRNDFVIVYREHRMLVNLDEEKGLLAFPRVSELKNTEELIYLFSIGEESFFLYGKGIFGTQAGEEQENALLSVYSFLSVKKIGSDDEKV